MSEPKAVPAQTKDDWPPKASKVRFRALRAYWVTFVVVMSYLSASLQARFRSRDRIERLLLKKHRRNADRILRAIQALQGLYIKVGQLISILSNVLPEEFRAGLETLQDRVPPRPIHEIEQRIREEFGGKSTAELFSSFDALPLAAASIGQVHRARLRDGRDAAVKIQYPDIDRVVHQDLSTLRRIVRIIERMLPDHGIGDVYREVRKIVVKELDFVGEAANIERIAQNFQGRSDVQFPSVVPEFSTSRVLTTTFVDGIKVSNTEALEKAGIDRKRLARLVIESYCQQIFTDRVYHADPHPGNLMVLPGPTLVFLDFGAVAEISPSMRSGMIEFVQGGLTGDTDKVIRGMRTMGFVSKGARPEIFERIVNYFHDRFKEEIHIDSLNLRDIKIDPQKGLKNLADLRRMNISLRDITDSFYVPKEWIMLERTILLLMGLCTELDPELNPMSVIRPYLERFVLSDGTDLSSFLLSTAQSATTNLVTLPSEIRRFIREVQRGGVRMSFPDVAMQVKVLYLAGQQLIWGAASIACLAFGIAFEDRGQPEVGSWFFGGAALAALLFLANFLTGRAAIKESKKNRP
ncbi:MAG: AarF/UbiB family protein [Polyangia bacterium]|jgi:predicted unusual protein kinase regulating ubiquinone biosynthesis (AarF/ABC1/UbiB family)|nr:AarF/UbiB family protein [Polyangia bacterium]